MRINESFGDIVNWDFLPDNAIDGITMIGANPVFGLNALGGAVTIDMSDGFNYQGAELDVRGGSFGRYQGALAYGGNKRQLGRLHGARGHPRQRLPRFSAIDDPAHVRRSRRQGRRHRVPSQLHGRRQLRRRNGRGPVQLLDLSWSQHVHLAADHREPGGRWCRQRHLVVTPTLTLLGRRATSGWFRQKHVDGNISEAEECATSPVLCLERRRRRAALRHRPRRQPRRLDPCRIASPLGSLDRTSQTANSWGRPVQGVDKSKLFGLGNQFLLGASSTTAMSAYAAASELGVFGPQFVVNGLGVALHRAPTM